MTPQAARIMWVAFLCAASGIIALAHFVPRPQSQPIPAPAFIYAITGVAMADLAILGIVRRNLLERSRTLSERGEATAGQAAWAVAQTLGLASAMSIVLFGFVLHTLGARPAWISTAFFVAGLLLMAAYRPQLPEIR
jgi:MFS family permease